MATSNIAKHKKWSNSVKCRDRICQKCGCGEDLVSHHKLYFNGETKPVVEWSEILGINAKTIYARKAKGWSDEKCLQPVGGK